MTTDRNETNFITLKDQIDGRRGEIRTEKYSMSVGEWLNIYQDGEVDIHPEWQRFFRWTRTQKTKLIESLLLGIPIPPIYVAQRRDGKWDVIDGLQRLATVFQFAGVLRDVEERLADPLILEGTKLLPALENKVWDEAMADKARPALQQRSLFHLPGEPPEISPLSPDQRLFVKRAKLDVSIILRESYESTKYELFQRLNTGGTQLSNQEVRNCVLIMLNRNMFTWLKDLAQDVNYRSCTPLTERQLQEQEDLEFALRFLALRRLNLTRLTNLGDDVNEFLTEEMRTMAEGETDYAEAESAFRLTFQCLANATADNTFRRYDSETDRFLGSFLVPAFETIASGVGHSYELWLSDPKALKHRIENLWSDETFLTYGRGGVSASTRISKLVPLGRKFFKP